MMVRQVLTFRPLVTLRQVLTPGRLQVLLHVGAILPLALLIWDYTHDQLTFNPIQEITFRTGRYGLTLLLLSLASTPINTVFGFKQVLRFRRALGLYAFMYIGLHFLTFTVLDYNLNPVLLREAIFEKRFALILLSLAVTSTKGWMKRLGKNWKRLHRLVYLAALLAVVHFVWLVKSDIRKPLLYGAVVLLLLTLRLPIVRKWVNSLRKPLRRERQVDGTRVYTENK